MTVDSEVLTVLTFALHRSTNYNMAFNISIENTIKSRKGEQAKIHETVQLCTEIINVISATQPKPSLDLEENVPADMSPVKKEEMELLEKALEKALQVRSGSKPSATRPNIVKPFGTQKEQGAAPKNALSTYKGPSKSKLSKTTERKKQRKDQSTVCHTLTKSVRTNDPHLSMTSNKLKALPDHGQHTSPCGTKKPTDQLCDKYLSAITDSTNSSASKTTDSERNCLFRQEEILKWTNLTHKKKRLWDKILAFEATSSTSGGDLFMARMRGTFPMRCPCGSPEEIPALVHRFIQQEQDLPENNEARAVLARQIPGDNTKQEWESWDRWRPEWGCLCSTGTESEWCEGRPLPLPKTVTYTSERDLAELETLRMRVALLQQESVVEKILSDTLSQHLSSAVCATLNPSLQRDLYSVLGEGGERFPAIVLDSEPDS